MKFGLIEAFGSLRIQKGSNYVAFSPPASIPSSFTLTLPSALPDSSKAVYCDSSGNLSFVTLSDPSSTAQSANTVLAGPTSGGSALPTFRALVYADLASLVGTASNTLAAGNDGRFHTQGTDAGTTSTTFHVDSDGSGPILKNASGVLEVRNSGDTGYANIVVGNVTVKGSTTVIESETLAIGDSVIVLNQDYTGSSPTENGGIEIERGTLTNASLLWDESADRWQAGLSGSELPLTRVYRTSFTNASLTAGVLTVTHNLGQQVVNCQVYDNNNKLLLPDDITLSSSSNLAVDLTSYGTLTGTYNVIVTG